MSNSKDCKLSKAQRSVSPSWLQCYFCVFPLWCWYVRHACQLIASVGPGRRGGRADFWTCSATRQKARRPPFTALRRTTWTGFCPTTAHAHLSTDRQRKNLKKTASEKLSACVCCLFFFLFPFFLLFCSSMRNGFTTPDTMLTSGIAFKGQDAAFYKLRNVVFIASHFCILRGASYRRSHYFWTVCFPPWKIAGTLPMCGLHFAM